MHREKENFRVHFAVLMVVALLLTVGAAAAAVPSLFDRPEPPIEVRKIIVDDPAPITNESIWCEFFGWEAWKWGYCPSWIPIPKKLQPILHPDTPQATTSTCNEKGLLHPSYVQWNGGQR